MRMSPDRAGWMVVTRSRRMAVSAVVIGVLFALLMASGLVLDATRHRPFHWWQLLWLVVAVVWTLRMVGNVRWLRRQGD